MSDLRIDAYCHVGLPRFGTVEDAWVVLKQAGIERAVFVLGPGVPDYATLFSALRYYGERARGVGIPFGETFDQVRASVMLQLRAGVLGFRVEPQALLAYPALWETVGTQGRWLYAIGAFSAPEATRALLDWLERFPEGQVAAPHCLSPEPFLTGMAADDARRALASHPRFYPIFSRHGGVGSHEPYPHRDLRPWVEQLIDLAGPDRMMWGSEYPVLFWRDETLGRCLGWLEALLAEAFGSEARRAFLGGNAHRVFFGRPAPPAW